LVTVVAESSVAKLTVSTPDAVKVPRATVEDPDVETFNTSAVEVDKVAFFTLTVNAVAPVLTTTVPPDAKLFSVAPLIAVEVPPAKVT